MTQVVIIITNLQSEIKQGSSICNPKTTLKMMDNNVIAPYQKGQAWKSVLIIIILFVVSLSFLICFVSRLPTLSEDDWKHVKFPRSVDDAKSLGLVLSHYKRNYYWEVLLTITMAYIFLQTFMIPGSVVFSILLGYLFPFILALLVVAFCSAVGASCCYLLASIVGGRVLQHFFPEKMEQCRTLTSGYKRHMYIYVFAMRIAPFIPNWLVNISCPIFHVPLMHFFIGTFFGVIPLSLLFVRAGTTLQDLTGLGVGSVGSVYTLLVFAAISLIPFLFTKQLKNKLL